MNITIDDINFSDIEKIIKSMGLTCELKINDDGELEGRCQQIDNSIKESPDNFDDDPPLHAKSLDMVAKHAKVYPGQGTLPSGHRGDLVKIRNGHGGYVPFNSNES